MVNWDKPLKMRCGLEAHLVYTAPSDSPQHYRRLVVFKLDSDAWDDVWVDESGRFNVPSGENDFDVVNVT